MNEKHKGPHCDGLCEGAAYQIEIKRLTTALEVCDVPVKRLRRALDNIKVRAYELGEIELHDMALAALKLKEN